MVSKSKVGNNNPRGPVVYMHRKRLMLSRLSTLDSMRIIIKSALLGMRPDNGDA